MRIERAITMDNKNNTFELSDDELEKAVGGVFSFFTTDGNCGEFKSIEDGVCQDQDFGVLPGEMDPCLTCKYNGTGAR